MAPTLLMPSPPAGPGAGEDDTAHQRRLLLRNHLRHETAQREAEEVDFREPQRLDEARRILGHGCDRIRRVAFRSADTAIVENDDVMPLCQAVDDGGVPIFEHRRQVMKENERNAALFANFPIDELCAADIGFLGGRIDEGGGHCCLSVCRVGL